LSAAHGAHDAVVRLSEIDVRLTNWRWDAADVHRREIEAHFAALTSRRSGVWNGRALLLCDYAFEAGRLSGSCFETDYASSVAWRDGCFTDDQVKNCFGMAVIQGADGGYLLGVMGSHTANADRTYFPAGTLEPEDVVDGRVDFCASIERELEEETGLAAAELSAEEGWWAVFAGIRIGIAQVFRTAEPAAQMRERILRHLAKETEPELSDIRIVHGPDDLDASMPDHVVAFLHAMWRRAT
jgi:8-oxo-dGTP pyrophosphatase MutT (NUDIX family)